MAAIGDTKRKTVPVDLVKTMQIFSLVFLNYREIGRQAYLDYGSRDGKNLLSG